MKFNTLEHFFHTITAILSMIFYKLYLFEK